MKKILKGVVLISGIALLTGCVNTTEPSIPKVEKIETTREVLIPHDDNVKKAVAILIHKINELESSQKDLSNKLLSQSKEEDLLGIKAEVTKETDEKLMFIKEEISKLSDELKAKKKQATRPPLREKEDYQNVSSSSEYDVIIKEFANEGSLK